MLASRQREGSTDSVAESHWVPVSDGRIHVRSAGRGPLVIFLHGWTLDSRLWQPQMALSRFQLIMPDRRGFGKSSAPPCLAAERHDILKIAAHFGATKFALVGLSQGAAVVLDIARNHSAQVAALAVIGAPLHDVVPEPAHVPEIDRAALAKLVRAGHLDEMMAHWAQHPLTQVAPVGEKLLADMFADYDGRDQLVDQESLHFTRQDIAALMMPVLAMAGEKDTDWRKDVARFIGSHAPHGRTEIIPEAGHLANVDQPDLLNSRIQEFLNAHHLKDF